MPDWWEDRGEGGGWLGAHGSHVVDQVRSTLGEFERRERPRSPSSRPAMTADDTYTVHFRTVTGVEGVMHSSAGTWGPMMAGIRISGTGGTRGSRATTCT